MSSIVLFDGVCNFCNGAVNFIISHDPEKKFRFAALQSETGLELKQKYAIGDDVDSVVLVEDDHAYLHSTAGLRIAKNLGGIWSLAYVFIVVPAFIRDRCYKLFAQYRYRMFGRQDACMLPTPDVRDRFLSEPGAIATGYNAGQ
jgi:predicted DCC family thiol-disulfide oxidoreductase YuxK